MTVPPIALIADSADSYSKRPAGSAFLLPTRRDRSAQTRPAFVLLLLATAALLVRPADLLPQLVGWPIYRVLMMASLVIALPVVLGDLRPRSLVRNPISACVLALVAAVGLSHVSRLSLYHAIPGSVAMVKLSGYYLLVVALVVSSSRLRTFLGALVGSIIVLTALAVLQYHGLLNLASLVVLQQAERDFQTGSVAVLLRLRSVGLFNDPNDLALIIVLGVVLCGYEAEQARRWLSRALYLALLAFLLYALGLTYSRGGLLALVVGLVAFLFARFGWRNAVLLASAMLPLVFLVFSGRQTSFDLTSTNDTFQTRLQLWSQTLDEFRAHPLLGIGDNQLVETIGQVTHNSFLHAYAELGLVGGTLFLGAFYAAYQGVRRAPVDDSGNAELARLQPYMFAIVAGYAAGLLTLSRGYAVSSYLVLAVLSAYATLASGIDRAAVQCNARFLREIAVASAVFLVATYLFVRLLVRWE